MHNDEVPDFIRYDDMLMDANGVTQEQRAPYIAKRDQLIRDLFGNNTYESENNSHDDQQDRLKLDNFNNAVTKAKQALSAAYASGIGIAENEAKRRLDQLYQSMRVLGYSIEEYDQAKAKLLLYRQQSEYLFYEYSEALIRFLMNGMPLVTALEQLDPHRPNDDHKDAITYAMFHIPRMMPNYDRVSRWAVRGNGVHSGHKVTKRISAQMRGYPKASYKEPGSIHQKRKAKKRW